MDWDRRMGSRVMYRTKRKKRGSGVKLEGLSRYPKIKRKRNHRIHPSQVSGNRMYKKTNGRDSASICGRCAGISGLSKPSTNLKEN